MTQTPLGIYSPIFTPYLLFSSFSYNSDPNQEFEIWKERNSFPEKFYSIHELNECKSICESIISTWSVLGVCRDKLQKKIKGKKSIRTCMEESERCQEK